MNKCTTRPPSAPAGYLVDKPRPFSSQVLESSIDIADCQRNMRHSLTAVRTDLADGSLRAKRLQQQNEGTTYRDHCLLDPLLLDFLAIQRFRSEKAAILSDRLVEVPYGYRNMIQVVRKHATTILRSAPAIMGHPFAFS